MIRLDKLLVEKGLVATRTQSQKLINHGAVQVNIQGMWMTLDKPSTKYPVDIELKVNHIEELKYVSRAGLKLEPALAFLHANQLTQGASLELCAQDKVILDIGQSTGGFTDCLLQRGAKAVVGVDVGHDQLAESLKENPAVTCLEGINARNLPIEQILTYAPEGFDWVVMDVSFISQTLIIENIPPCLKPGGLVISLVKPQFEVGRQHVAKGGIVRDKEAIAKVKGKITNALQAQGLDVLAYFESGLSGADGNQEYLSVSRKLSV